MAIWYNHGKMWRTRQRKTINLINYLLKECGNHKKRDERRRLMGIIAEAIADIKEPEQSEKKKTYRDCKEKSKRCGEGQARMIMGLVL